MSRRLINPALVLVIVILAAVIIYRLTSSYLVSSPQPADNLSTSTAGVPKTSLVKVYFIPPHRQPNSPCEEVAAVTRIIPYTPGVGRAAILELLKGPTEAEKTQGYSTIIPAGSKLNSLTIKDGIAYADFNERAQAGGGSCAQAAIVAQIKNTLLQFPTVKNVILSIEGQTENIFQP